MMYQGRDISDILQRSQILALPEYGKKLAMIADKNFPWENSVSRIFQSPLIMPIYILSSMKERNQCPSKLIEKAI